MINQPGFKYVFLAGDVACLSVAYIAALGIATPGDVWSVFEPLSNAAIVSVAYAMCLPLFLFIYLQNDLYKRQTFRPRYRHLLIVYKSLLVGTGIVLPGIVLFGWEFFSTYGRTFLVAFLAAAILLATVTRLVLVHLFVYRRGHAARKRRLLIVGGDRAARKVSKAIQDEPESVLEIVGIVDDYSEPGEVLFDDWVNLGRLEDVPGIVQKLRPEEILIAIDRAPYPRLVEVVDVCIETRCVVRVYSDRLETLANRIGAERYARDLPVIMLSQTQPGPLCRFVHRTIDVAVAALALTILSPILLAVCIGIKLSSPGPVIFRQTRIGMDGRPFDFYKFRTMPVGTSSELHERYIERFIKGKATPEPDADTAANVFKISDDPRVFPFGHFLRRTSIDELPQLLNVLKGDMGLVSPRPCLPYEWECYEDWHKARLSVLPGCTGLWQVLGRSSVTFEEMVIMDLYYISNRSFILDARILFKTVSVMLFGKGGF